MGKKGPTFEDSFIIIALKVGADPKDLASKVEIKPAEIRSQGYKTFKEYLKDKSLRIPTVSELVYLQRAMITAHEEEIHATLEKAGVSLEKEKEFPWSSASTEKSSPENVGAWRKALEESEKIRKEIAKKNPKNPGGKPGGT